MDSLTKEHRSWNMSRIRSGDTAPEKKLRSLLHMAGYRFRIHVRNLPGSPDIVLPKYRAVVFVHGCYWHRHEECKYAYKPKSRVGFWREKFKCTIERDMRKTDELKAAGWRVFVVWECELRKDPQTVLYRVSTNLRGSLEES